MTSFGKDKTKEKDKTRRRPGPRGRRVGGRWRVVRGGTPAPDRQKIKKESRSRPRDAYLPLLPRTRRTLQTTQPRKKIGITRQAPGSAGGKEIRGVTEELEAHPLCPPPKPP